MHGWTKKGLMMCQSLIESVQLLIAAGLFVLGFVSISHRVGTAKWLTKIISGMHYRVNLS